MGLERDEQPEAADPPCAACGYVGFTNDVWTTRLCALCTSLWGPEVHDPVVQQYPYETTDDAGDKRRRAELKRATAVWAAARKARAA